MLVSELRDKCIHPWEPVFLNVNDTLRPIVSISKNIVHVGNKQESLFAHEILEELEGKYGELEIKI